MMTTAAILVLLLPHSALASGEYVMPYSTSALASIGITIWITNHLVQKLWAKIVSLVVVLATIYETWEYVNPSPRSLMRNFGWWKLLLTAIPVLTGTLTAIGLRFALRSS